MENGAFSMLCVLRKHGRKIMANKDDLDSTNFDGKIEQTFDVLELCAETHVVRVENMYLVFTLLDLGFEHQCGWVNWVYCGCFLLVLYNLLFCFSGAFLPMDLLLLSFSFYTLALFPL